MILIKDGRVVDPASGIDEALDVVIDNGTIKTLGKFPKVCQTSMSGSLTPRARS